MWCSSGISLPQLDFLNLLFVPNDQPTRKRQFCHVHVVCTPVAKSTLQSSQLFQFRCLTLIIFWHSNKGRPTKLVPFTERIWSPTLSLPDLAAGPSFARCAMMAQGIMDPQPDSTIITPSISAGFLLTITYNKTGFENINFKVCSHLERSYLR